MRRGLPSSTSADWIVARSRLPEGRSPRAVSPTTSITASNCMPIAPPKAALPAPRPSARRLRESDQGLAVRPDVEHHRGRRRQRNPVRVQTVHATVTQAIITSARIREVRTSVGAGRCRIPRTPARRHAAGVDTRRKGMRCGRFRSPAVVGSEDMALALIPSHRFPGGRRTGTWRGRADHRRWPWCVLSHRCCRVSPWPRTAASVAIRRTPVRRCPDGPHDHPAAQSRPARLVELQSVLRRSGDRLLDLRQALRVGPVVYELSYWRRLIAEFSTWTGEPAS